MNRRNFLKTVGIGAAAMMFGGCTEMKLSSKTKEAKPNFVFILMDDLGWADLGCYGSKFYETPNIDKLAREGMKFTEAYAACPVCSPTRASIMSGKYPARLHITDFIGGDRRLAPFLSQLPLEEVTIAEAFKQAGYSTEFVGKWHLGRHTKYGPLQQGFDINKGGCHRGQPPSYFSPYKIETLEDGPEGEYLTDRLTNEAVKFINDNKDRPFLLYLSHYAVHTPLQAKKEMIEKYEAKPKPEDKYLDMGRNISTKLVQNNPVFAAMVQSSDESVGKVMEAVKTAGIEDNTIIIFMSDNGGLSTLPTGWHPSTSNSPLRAGKGWLYEGGIREPMIVKWPGVTKPGSICDVPVTSTDFYPTMLKMAGLKLRPKQHCDGVSFAGLLKGEKSLSRNAIYWHYPHYHGSGSRPSGAVRAGDYKLIEFYADNYVELYNIKDDMRETTDISAQNPEITKKLRNMLHRWLKQVDAVTVTPKQAKEYLEMIKEQREKRKK